MQNETCTTCGMWRGLHKFDTMRCPANDREDGHFLETTYAIPTEAARIAALEAELKQRDQERAAEMELQLHALTAALDAEKRAKEKYIELTESIDAILETEMGEWYAVTYAHLPSAMAGLGLIRTAVDALEARK
jgi:hypothetical protein